MMNTFEIITCLLLISFSSCRTPRAETGYAPLPPEISPNVVVSSESFAESLIAFVDGGQPEKAIRLFEESHTSVSDRVQSRTLIAYLDALVQAGETRKLIDFMLIDREADRNLAAWSLIRLGDLHMEEGDISAALVDGYLRACLLFEDTCMRQRALEKTIHALQLQGDDRAGQFQKLLEAEFPESKTSQ